jgi:hypothetical protein
MQQAFLRSRAHILRRSVQDLACAPCRVFVFQELAPFLGPHPLPQGLPFAAVANSKCTCGMSTTQSLSGKHLPEQGGSDSPNSCSDEPTFNDLILGSTLGSSSEPNRLWAKIDNSSTLDMIIRLSATRTCADCQHGVNWRRVLVYRGELSVCKADPLRKRLMDNSPPTDTQPTAP